MSTTLEQAEQARDALLVKSQKAFAVAVALQWELDAAIRERDAARQSRARLVQLWNERGISARSWHAAERTWKP